MSLAVVGVSTIAVLALAYRFYGKYIASKLGPDDSKITPANEINDGVDFVPTKPFYLLGQHFSAIAAAGPIVGPIAACITFGWVPCLLWIGIGVVAIGAVHDFTSLFASVRHKASSIVEIAKINLGKRAWIAMMIFIWISLVYVIVAFVDVTTSTFLGKIEELQGVNVKFNSGGAVAAASTAYLLLAVIMGVVQKLLKPPLWLSTIIFVPAILVMVWLGTQVSETLLFSAKTWYWLILGYCFVASLMPVWLLLQPRGYLGGFVLYMALFVGIVGIFFGGYTIKQPGFKSVGNPGFDQTLFPFLFVTIACGACSGFHGLVCSGTTSKQIEKESHCKPIGYGGMLLEAFVALIALSTVMIVAGDGIKGRGPSKLYGDGIAEFLTLLIGKEHMVFAITFGSMVFSTFVFDTIDVATRLGRYILQELFASRTLISGALATAITAGVPLVFLLNAEPGSWKTFWVLFGTSNQLLAGLTLLTLTVWLKTIGKPSQFTLIPMFFIMAITIYSLVLHVNRGLSLICSEGMIFNPVTLNGMVAVLLLMLSAILVIDAIRIARKTRQEA